MFAWLLHMLYILYAYIVVGNTMRGPQCEEMVYEIPNL